MVPFDPRAYESEVVKPLRRRLPHLPDDLLSRYAVDLDMDAGQLRERTDAVVRLWARIAQRAGPSGLVCTQFLREHDDLTRAGGADLTDPGWWRRRQRNRHRQLEPDIADLAALLTASHGGLGVITAAQLRAAAAAHGTLGDADLERARAAAGLNLLEPVPLPAAPGTRGRFDTLTTKLIAAGVDSIPRLLFPQLTTFGLLDGFTVAPVPAGRTPALGRAAIAERARELDTLPDGPSVRATREAVGMLVTEAGAGTDLSALSLFHLLVPAREKRDEGAGARTLFGLLTRTGLTPAEAGRLAVSVLAEPTGRAGTLTTVSALLADGRLLAAQRAADGLTGAPGEAARAAVRARREEVDQLRQAAAADLRAGNHERAADRLHAALGLAGDLPGLSDELARVPAAAVLDVRADPDQRGVRVSWRPAPEHAEDTEFRVVRGSRSPADPDDGVVVPRSAASGPTATVDEVPPVGRTLSYAVFARVPGGRWSRSAGAAPVRVVPPVADLHVEGGAGVITGRFRTHPEVTEVQVRRFPGEPAEGPGHPVTAQHDGFRDETAEDGVRYRYAVVAEYAPVEPGGPVLRSEPVLGVGATRPEPRPVRVLTADPVTGDGRLAVRLSWRQPPGSEVVVRWAAQPCPWSYGQPVPAAEIAGYGQELTGERRVLGAAVTLVAALPAGRAHCVPFTLGSEGGLRGQDAVVDLLHPVGGLQARRLGDELLLSWAWPDAASVADVSWPGGSRRITPIRYREEGGCRLPAPPGPARVEVTAVLLGVGGDEGRSPAAAVAVPGRSPRIGYQLRRRGHRLTGGVRCEVTLSGAEPVPEVTVLVVAAPGTVLPGSPAAGTELLRAAVRIAPGVPVRLEAAVPALPRPYWLRCFLAEPAPALLVDPPVGQLKVS